MKHFSIDIGGTKIRYALLNDQYEILEDNIYNTSDFFHKNGIQDLENLFPKLQEYIKNKNIKTMGISINCAIYEDIIIYSSLLNGGEGINLKKLAQRYFKVDAIYTDNDVYCMAKAELKLGVGNISTNFVYINLGTGIRLAAVTNGMVIKGFKGLAGEICLFKKYFDELHAELPIEEVISGKGIENISKRLLGKEIKAEEIFSSNNQTIIPIFINNLSDFLVQVSLFYNPELIIFGGSLIKSAHVWLPPLKEKYQRNCVKLFRSKDILTSTIKHPASIGAILQ